MLKSLKASGAIKTTGLADEEFDLLVVGGGATGAGVAVDAASRGLKVALVERDDFSAGEQLFLFLFLLRPCSSTFVMPFTCANRSLITHHIFARDVV
jgi:heterodisulfide reductase subunit A-like polyferredoxin